MKKHIKELFLHYADEMGEVRHSWITRVTLRTLDEHCPRHNVAQLNLRDNALDDTKSFKDLLDEGQELRKKFDKDTAGMSGAPNCSKCGDTGRTTTHSEGIAIPAWCTCPKGRPSPLAESLTKAFQQSAADVVRTTLDRGGTAVGEVHGQWRVVSKTCEHGNTACQKCGVGQPVRDPRQDLKPGDHVRFEIEGIIKERQSAGILQDYDGNDFEPIQYAIKDSINRMTYYVGYDQITKKIGSVE
jgi:hypothetical protein